MIQRPEQFSSHLIIVFYPRNNVITRKTQGKKSIKAIFEDKQKHIIICPHHARCIVSKINTNKSIFVPGPLLNWFSMHYATASDSFMCFDSTKKKTYNERSAVEGVCRTALCERSQKTFHNNAVSLVVEIAIYWSQHTQKSKPQSPWPFMSPFISLFLCPNARRCRKR